MTSIGIFTEPAILHVELPREIIESSSVSTFLPEEEASIYPLLSNNIGTCTPLTISHPLTSDAGNDCSNSGNMENEDTKAETSSSSGSSSGIGIDVGETAATKLFSKPVFKHPQKNNGMPQESNGYGPNGNLYISQDAPLFVSWNWPLIRKCTFFLFISSLLAMCAVVIAMIITIPKTCNPRTAWFRGSVFYEIFPASFQDSNNDGLGDILGIAGRADYIASMGISAVRLNSIFSSQYYPNDYENATSLTEIATGLGTEDELKYLLDTLHLQNISLVLDLPIYPLLSFLEKTRLKTSNLLKKQLNTSKDSSILPSENFDSGNLVSKAIFKWTQLGVDGFYIKGLENFTNHKNTLSNIAEWRSIIGKNRVLIISESVFVKLELSNKAGILESIDLVDVRLDVFNGTKNMKKRIQEILSSDITPSDLGIWIQWSIGGFEKNRIIQRTESQNFTIAATLMQLMLPGTTNIYHGDEISFENPYNIPKTLTKSISFSERNATKWSNSTTSFTKPEKLPRNPISESLKYEDFQVVKDMIKLRNYSPSIYKNAICKGFTTLPNTQLRTSDEDIIIVERSFPRRNSFVSVSNYGHHTVTLDMTSMYYSGYVMLGETRSAKIYFDNFEIGPMETIIVKLDK